jgi:Outer membrane protein beta-barrel domain
MKNGILYLIFLLPICVKGQGYAFGVKGGLAIGSQRWNQGGSYDNSLLFKYQGSIFIESAPEDPTSVMFAEAGYHVRGSAFRYRRSVGVTVSGSQVEIPAYTQEFRFNNLALILGFKRRGVLNRPDAFYTIGLRGDYTLNTTLPSCQTPQTGYYFFSQCSEFVRKFNFGLSVSGGYEFKFTDLIGSFVELSVHPDITKQYFQPPVSGLNYYDPYTGGRINSIPEQNIRNISFEVTLGFRFLRKIEYID